MDNQTFTLLDGAMGTLLQQAGLPAGQAPETWNRERPETIIRMEKEYLAAGAQVIYANTFGANRWKCPGEDIPALITAGVTAARRAVEGTGARVALDVGPIGQLLEPLGSLSFDDAYDMFREVVTAGEAAGADLVVFETMSDLYEVKAAVLAARENTALPVWVTMTFEASGRSFVGVTVPAMALTLTGLGVDAMGFNCSLGPRELLPLVRTLAEWTDRPIILKPNAGLPDPATGTYATGPEEFAQAMAEAAELGVSILGGCCGTTPAYIAALRTVLADKVPAERAPLRRRGLCSGTHVTPLDSVRVVGERINPTGKKRFQQALRAGDIAHVLELGVPQQDAGADILDVNVGLPGVEEPALMKTVVQALQGVVELPLQIDSSDPAALEAGLRYHNGKAIVNSVNGDEETLARILPLCKKYGAAVIGLTMDKEGIPPTAEGRLAIARRILSAALAHGLAREDVIIDCLTLTVSAQQEQAAETLRALRLVHEELGLRTTLGVSNISFGLPAREKITACFLAEALNAGLDLPILNPGQEAVMEVIHAHRLLSGEDRNGSNYIARYAAMTAQTAAVASAPAMTVTAAVTRGLKAETAELVRQALDSKSPMEVIHELLIPALDAVGEGYEKQELFLPQLINAANAACAGFEQIRARLTQNGEPTASRGKILLATVQGDIHDIGKNIVRVILENYGYTVIDLGRDVPPETVVDTAIREDVHLIGLSALMTTTLPAMAETIRALRASSHPCTIWVGGAVLTADYARAIGADHYAKDAKQSADIAKLILG